MKKILRVGIVGYGVVGQRRRRFIDEHAGLRTIAICDQKFKKPSIMPDGVMSFNNYKELLKEDLDILFVSIPNYLAADVTIAGLKKRLHIFCEKPPGRDVADIKRVISVEKKHQGQLLKYGFNHRYHDSVREAMRIVKSGELGKIINIRGVYGKSRIWSPLGQWRTERKYAGGGILLDQGIHMVDLMRLFCGNFVDVKSYVSNSHWKHDVEDNAYAIMKDEEGRMAMLHSSATQWQHRFTLDITLTEGYLELQGILSGSKSYGEEKLIIGKRTDLDVGALQEESTVYLQDNSWRDEVNEFADAVIKGKKIVNGTSREALATMDVIYRIYYADPVWRKKYGIKKPEGECHG